MKQSKPIVEYGVPIDPRTMIEPPDPDALELESAHPGIGDDAYVTRRHELFALCRRHRITNIGPPVIDYLPEEQRIWREVSAKLDGLHRRHACSMYLAAKDTLGISSRGQARRSSKPKRTAAWIQEAAMLLPSPTQATDRPAIGPRCYSKVITSAISWQGWVRSVRPLITGTVA